MKYEITVLPSGVVPTTNADLDEFARAALVLHASVPVDWIKVDLSVLGPPAVYTYKIRRISDQAVWDQKIQMDSATDPGMTFDTHSLYWRKASEFGLQRPIRDAIVRLLAAYPTITRIWFTTDP